MIKFKKVLLAGTAAVMTAALAISGTMAYLTSDDSDVNVMTLGNVSIEQNEEQRVDVSKTGILTEADIEQFEQDKPLLPYVDTNLNQAMRDDYEEVTFPSGQVYKLFIGDNAIDKFVSVTNTGESDAYVRTIIALEAPTKKIDLSFNSKDWTMDKVASSYQIEVDGVKYDLFVCEYKNVLAPGETTPYSLMQFLIDGTATNEDLAAYGNYYDILVLSQAVQANGFDSASIGLDTAFGLVNKENAEKWFDNELPEKVKVAGDDKTALVDAINEAEDGDIVVLTEDTTIAGYDADKKLVIDKAITLDLNGQTITTESGWGGIDAKGGCSIINGTINHTGNTAAIKAFQVNEIKNVTINVTQTAGKTKGGIVVQNGDSSIGSIKNVTINGATNGIECYHSTNELAIGSMKNVKINATANGIYLNGAGKIGTISNCKISGGNIGINAYLANLWHISLDIKESEISGGTGSGIDIWDESATNTGSTVTFNYDAASKFVGGAHNIKVTLQEEVACTINGVKQDAPCAFYK